MTYIAFHFTRPVSPIFCCAVFVVDDHQCVRVYVFHGYRVLLFAVDLWDTVFPPTFAPLYTQEAFGTPSLPTRLAHLPWTFRLRRSELLIVVFILLLQMDVCIHTGLVCTDVYVYFACVYMDMWINLSVYAFFFFG